MTECRRKENEKTCPCKHVECERHGNIPVRPKDVLDKLERYERLMHYQ